MQLPSDAQAREEALNPHSSFIVQAPAGSGKTETLTQRYLNLLAHAQNDPEEVIALTFTNKAANEMQHRIYQALLNAKTNKRPSEAHKAKTYDLARAALHTNDEKQWALLDNPKRLRIMTIDAFCQFLSSKLMFESEDAFSASVTDAPDMLYEKALDDLLADTDEQCPWFAEVSALMLHLDNDWQRLKSLLMRMLSKREQWLPVVFELQLHQMQSSGKAVVEAGLHQMIETVMQDCYEILFPDGVYESKLLEILNYCAKDEQYDQLFAQVENLPVWQALIKLLFTDKSTLRKTFNAKNALPAGEPKAKAYSQWLRGYVESFSDKDRAKLTALVDELRLFDQAYFTPKQWQLLSDISALAIHALKYLKLVFEQKGKLDFNEVTLQALSALGSEGRPADIALYLDYQIRHILIDEFQDTSILQFQLLKMLTLEWQQGDGKTLFIVGDPMQSIYRFRQAEVNLFLQVKKQGIAQLMPKYLQLSCNFRSNKVIVDWVNKVFSQIFPAQDEINYGGISYSASDTLSLTDDDTAINAQLYMSIEEESLAIAKAIVKYQNQQPLATIAILVRSRSHLKTLVPVLKSQGVTLFENEIETLYDQDAAKDLLALSAMLCQPYEPYYWISLLTSNLFAFSLQALLPLCQALDQPKEQDFYQSLFDYANSSDHKHERAFAKLNAFLHQLEHLGLSQATGSLVERVKIAWRLLDGELIYPDSQQIVSSYMALLRQYLSVDKSLLMDVQKLTQKLKQQYVSAANEGGVQIMTIHKSKGLEFDFVIIPQLHKSGRSEDSDLFLYEQVQLADQKSYLLLSPIKHGWERKAPALYQAIQMMQKKRAHFELQRLLYVACTRAKQKLWLSAIAQAKAPAKDSLAALLNIKNIVNWQYLLNDGEALISQQNTRYRQIKPIIHFATLSDSHMIVTTKEAQTENLPFIEQIVLDDERIIGTVLHQLFDYVIKYKVLLADKRWERYCHQLIRSYALDNTLEKKMQHLATLVLRNTWQYYAWIFQADGMSEQVMRTAKFAKVTKRIADRVIVSGGELMVIDYKFGMPPQEVAPEDFLNDQIQQYQEQVSNYRYLLAKHYQVSVKHIKGALYFPLLPKLVNVGSQ